MKYNNKSAIQYVRNSRVHKNWPELWHVAEWLVHHDNVSPHQAFMVKKFLARNGTTVLEQPLYSPDLAPCDFWWLDKLKDAMRGDHLGSIETIKQESSRILNAIPEIEF